MKFPCTSCGCCCKRIRYVVQSINIYENNHPLYFPHRWTSEGVCEHLTEDNKCAIYETRPLLCNIEKLTELLGYDKKKFYLENIMACNKMMEEDNIPLDFRIEEKL